VFVAGTGLVLTGLGGNDTAQTAAAAVAAATYTIVLEEALRMAVDRNRPQAGQTPFGFGNTPAAQSGFPSLHAGGSFALVTPFAIQYNAPWLYGLATLAGVGRIQQRQHYVSDVVAGSLLGYTVGGVINDATRRRGLSVGMTGPQSVALNYRF
jgi:membrane-associated phospholipid phosphatase